MKESGVKRDDRFYYTLLDAYADSGRTFEAAQILNEMKEEGVEPRQFLYEKVGYINSQVIMSMYVYLLVVCVFFVYIIVRMYAHSFVLACMHVYMTLWILCLILSSSRREREGGRPLYVHASFMKYGFHVKFSQL